MIQESSRKRKTFFENYLNLSLWVVLIGAPLGLVLGLGWTVYEKYLEPKPIDEKYCYFEKSYRNYEAIYFYKKKSDARKAIKTYQLHNSIGSLNSGANWPMLVYPGTKVKVIRYSNDSSIARVRLERRDYDGNISKNRGWLPTIVLHDTIYLQH